MGEVYRADDLELGQSVALKFLPDRVAADPTWLDRFRNEVRTARQIAHPNVCRIYDIAQEDGHIFLSMEYIDGEDLGRVLRRLGRPSSEKAIEIARQICLGLAAAHENNVLHRDLKPANIMIDGRGRVRITDFGLAGYLDELEQTESRAGTPAYMAPEQLEHGKVSARSDIYTLGLILYELFTGKCVFETNNAAELTTKHTTGSVSSPSSITSDIDPAVERVTMRCLEPQPEDRPQSVYQVLAALPGGDPLAAALAAGETPSPELVANARDACGLQPPAAIGLLVAVLAFLAITYFAYAGTTLLPKRPASVMSVLAEQVMEDFGYVDLPRNSVSGYDVNEKLAKELKTSPRTVNSAAAEDWPPKFRYWRRWSKGPFIPVNFHAPEAYWFGGLNINAAATASLGLDSAGRLRSLIVGPELSGTSTEPSADFDWSEAFERAGLDRANAKAIPLAEQPPVHCNTVAAWQIDGMGKDGNHVTIQMGESGGRLNYFEILGLESDMARIFPGLLPISASIWGTLAVQFVMVFLAWRNLRASRGDRRNAIRCAMVVGGFYVILEVMSLQLQTKHFSDGTAIAHIVIHAVAVWMIYMAVEPYVRRVWPRMLVGLVRLLSLRVKDPAVGREVLWGVFTGCGLVAVLALMQRTESGIEVGAAARLPNFLELHSMMSWIRYLCFESHRAGSMALYAAIIAGMLIAIRLLLRHTLATILAGILILGILSGDWYMNHGGNSIALAVVYGAVSGTALVLLFTRIGILGGMIAMFLTLPFHRSLPGPDSWAASHNVVEAAIVLALAVYGLWIALAGRPIFKDILAEPQPER
jgi:serine/threonine-protein kinase